MALLLSAKGYRESKPIIPDLPLKVEGVSPEEDRVYLAEAYGIVPYITLETATDREGKATGLVKFYGIPVVALEGTIDEKGRLRIEKRSYKEDAVKRAEEKLSGQEINQNVLAGVLYGVVHYPEPQAFAHVFGNASPRGLIFAFAKDDKGFLSQLGIEKRKVLESGNLNYESIVRMNALVAEFIERNREQIGRELIKAILVEADDYYFMRNNADNPVKAFEGSGLIPIWLSDKRIVVGGTPLANKVKLVVAKMLNGMGFDEAIAGLNRSDRAIFSAFAGGDFLKKTKEFLRINKAINKYNEVLGSERHDVAKESLVKNLRKIWEDFEGFISTDKLPPEERQTLEIFALIAESLKNEEHLRVVESQSVKEEAAVSREEKMEETEVKVEARLQEEEPATELLPLKSGIEQFPDLLKAMKERMKKATRMKMKV